MSTNSKLSPLESKVHSLISNKSRKENENKNSLFTNENELTAVFKDMQISALTRAAYISPDVKSVTLGNHSILSNHNESTEVAPMDDKTEINSVIPFCSTPKKDLAPSLPKSLQNKNKIHENVNNVDLYLEKKNLVNEHCFSNQKLLQEFDNQRRLTVDKVMRQRIQNMYDTGKLIRESLEHLKQARQEEAITRRILLESKILNDIQEQEILNRPKREAQWAKDNLKEAQRIQERNQKVKEAEEEARKKSEAILLKRKQIDSIFELQKEYSQEYKNMLETIKSCKDKASVLKLTGSHSKTIKDCAAVCESVLKRCQQGNVGEEDVKCSQKVVETIKSVHEYFKKEIVKINEMKDLEASQKKEEEQKKTESQPGPIPEKNESAASDLSDCYDARSLQLYLSLKDKLDNIEKTIAPLATDDSMKKFRFNCQKAVTIPVNAISPVSSSHLIDKYMKLHNLLAGKSVDVGEIRVSASQHPLGIPFCKNLLAKKFVRQGDLTVSSKPDAAFSLAAVLASLWIDFPDFGQLVLAHFYSSCPYLAPVFMPQVEGQSDEDYHKSLGYHYSQNGDVEKQDSFLKRMSGIMRLYAALIISKPRQPGKMNPLGLSEGWRWISAILNLEPRPDICATLLYDFLDVAGSEMFKVYGGQFKKLLAYICQEYFPKLEKVTPSSAGGPIVRLEGFLQKVLKEESIQPPHGVLPSNFW